MQKEHEKKVLLRNAYLFQTQDGFEWYLSFLYQDKSHFYNRMFDKMIHTLISLHQEDRTLNSKIGQQKYKFVLFHLPFQRPLFRWHEGLQNHQTSNKPLVLAAFEAFCFV